ncbi:MAG TPA: hypothetical protein VGC72_15890 [Candidatus Elarobacter sp.]
MALGGCGGGGGGATVPSQPPLQQTGLERLTITIPARSSSLVARTPRYISSLTQSVTVTIPGGTSTTFTLTTSSPNCTPGSAGLTCVITFPVPVGTTSVQFATFASTDGSGTPLSVATVPVTVTAGQTNDVTVTLNGVVKSIALSVAPATVTIGTASIVNVSVSALDAGGAVIAGPGNYVDAQGNTLTLTLTDSDGSGATHLSQTTFTAPPSAAVTLSYNGAAIPDVTLTLSAPGVQSATATVHPNPTATQQLYAATRSNHCSPPGPENAFVYTYATLSSNGGGVGPLAKRQVINMVDPVGFTVDRSGFEDVLQVNDGSFNARDGFARYSLAATGTPAPVGDVQGSNTLISGAAAIAADSTGAVWIAQPATNVRPAMLMQFAPNADGNVAPVRTITSIVGQDPNLVFKGNMVAVDSHDRIYTFATDPATFGGRIYELPANSSGAATPIASYPVPVQPAINGVVPQHISVDQHTDAVWVYPVNPQPFQVGMIRFSQGNPTSDRAIYGQTAFDALVGVQTHQPNLWSLAFDDRGDVYVEYSYGTRSNDGCPITHVATFSPTQQGNVAPVDNTAIGGGEVSVGIAIPYSTPPTSSASLSGHPSNAVITSPTSMSFIATGPQYGQTLTAVETGYTGAFTATSGNTAIATVQPSSSSSGSFTVVAVGAGNTTITVMDASGNTATVPVVSSITAFHLQGHR